MGTLGGTKTINFIQYMNEHRKTYSTWSCDPYTIPPFVLWSLILIFSPHFRNTQRAAMCTTVGKLEPPLGNVRLQISKLVSSLLITNTAAINAELARLGTIKKLLVRASLILVCAFSLSRSPLLFIQGFQVVESGSHTLAVAMSAQDLPDIGTTNVCEPDSEYCDVFISYRVME